MRTSALTMPSRHRDAGRSALVILFAIASMLTIALFALLANASFLAMTACAQPATERFVLPGQRIEICNLAGAVRIVQGSGTRAEVIVTRGGRDAGRLRIEQDEHGDRSRLSVVFPDHRVVYPRLHGFGRSTIVVTENGCFQEGHGFVLGNRKVTITGGGIGMQAWADLEVRLPREHQTTLNLGVGEVSAVGVDGDLTIDVAAASVEAERTTG